MKCKINMPWLSIRLGLLLLSISLPQLLSAQEGDSTRVTREYMKMKMEGGWKLSPSDVFPEKTTTHPLYPSSRQLGDLPAFKLKEDELRLPYQLNPSLYFRGDFRTGGVMKQFAHGEVFGSGGQTSVPGIGRFNNASLGYRHIFSDRLSLQLRANTMKINMDHFIGQTFSTSGRLTYRTSDRVAFNLFGSYDIGNSYGMSTDSYGVTMSLDMSERFGMEVGVQRYYNSMRSSWETVPVVIPYYNFDHFKLGFDVGGVLYEILRNAFFGKDLGGGPTIGPPRFSFPVK